MKKKPLFQKRYEKYGLEGYGDTITDAKADWEARLITALEGDYYPYLMCFKGIVCLVYRSLDGWVSGIIREDDYNKKLHLSAHYNQPIEEILMSVRSHLAQLAWNPGDNLAEYFEYIGDEEKARTFQRWVDFQVKYAELRAAGLSDFEAHQQAWWVKPFHKGAK